MNPTFSIITVNLNNGSGLEKTIESVICQTNKSFEFIVVDGASKDESVSVIEHYSSQIDISISEPDTGIFNAMNKGIRLAKGKYCLFLNSDDILASEDVLAKVAEIAEQSAPFISGNQINDFGDHRQTVKNKGRYLTLYDFYWGTIKHQATFIRRDLFDTYGLYDESLKIVSDWKFFLQTIGLHNEQPIFIDVDIVVFAWFGMSTNVKIQELHNQEREVVLSENVLPTIRIDYEKLHDLKNYEYLILRMKNNSGFRFLVKVLAKVFK